MSDDSSQYVNVIIDFEPNLVKTPEGRRFLEKDLESRCADEAVRIVSRLAELDQILTTELGEYFDFMAEARQAFCMGCGVWSWR